MRRNAAGTAGRRAWGRAGRAPKGLYKTMEARWGRLSRFSHVAGFLPTPVSFGAIYVPCGLFRSTLPPNGTTRPVHRACSVFGDIAQRGRRSRGAARIVETTSGRLTAMRNRKATERTSLRSVERDWEAGVGWKQEAVAGGRARRPRKEDGGARNEKRERPRAAARVLSPKFDIRSRLRCEAAERAVRRRIGTRRRRRRSRTRSC